MNVYEQLQRFAAKEYGQFILVDPPVLDPDKQTYQANIRANYPVYIHDDRNPSDYRVRVLKIQSLGSVYLNKDAQILPHLTTYREQCDTNLTDLLKLWREQAENIVVSCSSDNLVQIKEFQNHFNQIEVIVDYLKEFNRITDFEVARYNPKKDRSRLNRYLHLLEELELVRREGLTFVPGRQFVLFEEKAANDDALKQSILSYILRNRYITIRDFFKITILEKTIGIESMIYLPEIETGEPIHRRPATIALSYKNYYERNINPIHLNHILKRLERCKAIERQGSTYHGSGDLREMMINRKKDLPPLSISPLTKQLI